MTVRRPDVHLGFAKTDPNVSLNLNCPSLLCHGTVLAQSGAGKSTLIGRLVEEILVKTKARVIVVDTNADFRKAYQIAATEDAKVWERDAQAGGLSPAEFLNKWNRISKTYIADRTSAAVDNPKWVLPYLSWNVLPRAWQMEILGLDLSRHPEEVAALDRVMKRLGEEELSSDPISLDDVRNELGMVAATSTTEEPLRKNLAVSVQMRCRQAAQLDLWRTEAKQKDLAAYLEERPRLLVLDVPAITKRTKQVNRKVDSDPLSESAPLAGDEPKRGIILLAYLLDVVWRLARQAWDAAVDDPQSDHRRPTFLVIDEAHNFVPDNDPVEPLALRVADMIQRVAAEGRKYGLFLLLVTQRPQKIRKGLLWECENLCLLRLLASDVQYAGEIWGLPKPVRDAANQFQGLEKGEGYLFGRWSEGEFFKGSERRTAATGGDLKNDWC